MHQNRLWLGFLAVMALIVIWYGGVALYRVYEYMRLTKYTQAHVYEWTPKEVAGDSFAPEARYTFSFKGTEYKGVDTLHSPIYRNAWAIEQEIPKLQEEERIAWFDPSDPTHSSLQKRFPLKDCVSAAALLGIFLYFLGLGLYVGRKQ